MQSSGFSVILGEGFDIRLTEWLFPQLEEEEEEEEEEGNAFIFQQDGSPPQ